MALAACAPAAVEPLREAPVEEPETDQEPDKEHDHEAAATQLTEENTGELAELIGVVYGPDVRAVLWLL